MKGAKSKNVTEKAGKGADGKSAKAGSGSSSVTEKRSTKYADVFAQRGWGSEGKGNRSAGVDHGAGV